MAYGGGTKACLGGSDCRLGAGVLLLELTELDMELMNAGSTDPIPQPIDSRPAAAPAEVLEATLASLEDSKAEDIVNIDVAGKSTLADHMIVATGRSNRHVGAIADRLVEDLGAIGVKGIRVEGLPHCDWVLIDAGDLIIHVFRPEVRQFYNLEKMWAADPVAEHRAR